MPRAFSAAEREHIRGILMTTARDHFTRHGLRGTSVGDLARAAGIAKGSFYLFFESKELLFFAVLLEAESEVRETLVRRIDRSFASATQFIEHVLQVQMDLLQSHPLLRSLNDPESAVMLMRAVPPEALEAAKRSDELFLHEVLKRKLRPGSSALSLKSRRLLALLPRALHALNLQEELIGPEARPLQRLIIRSVAESLGRDDRLR